MKDTSLARIDGRAVTIGVESLPRRLDANEGDIGVVDVVSKCADGVGAATDGCDDSVGKLAVALDHLTA